MYINILLFSFECCKTSWKPPKASSSSTLAIFFWMLSITLQQLFFSQRFYVVLLFSFECCCSCTRSCTPRPAPSSCYFLLNVVFYFFVGCKFTPLDSFFPTPLLFSFECCTHPKYVRYDYYVYCLAIFFWMLFPTFAVYVYQHDVADLLFSFECC